jgi:hypothetical protein
MKKRELKQFTKEINKFTHGLLNPKEKRVMSADKQKVKLPYKMF